MDINSCTIISIVALTFATYDRPKYFTITRNKTRLNSMVPLPPVDPLFLRDKQLLSGVLFIARYSLICWLTSEVKR